MCEERDLVPEMMYLLGKMGDNRKALYLIIERVGDVDMVLGKLQSIIHIC